MNAYSSLCGMVGLSMGQLGNFEEGIIFFEKGIDNGVRVGDLHALATIEAWYSILWRLKGDGRRVIDHAQKSIKYYGEMQFSYGLGFSWSCSGYGYHLLGAFDVAQEHIEKGLNFKTDSGVVISLSVYHVGLSMVHCRIRVSE
jgi:tetratricopeptide (TPR) repeat protein